MFINRIKKAGGSGEPNIDDILSVVNTKLFMPFTDNLLDNSVWNIQITNNSNVTLNENGAVFNGSTSYLKHKTQISSSSDFTIEILVDIDSSKSSNHFILDLRSTTVTTYNGYVIYFVPTTKTLTFQAGLSSENNIINVTTDSTKFHLAITKKEKTISIYINGILKGSKEILQNQTLGIDTYLGNTNTNIAGTQLKGSIGGYKITEKLLIPYQFSLLRPMQLNYTTKVGEKEYIYKKGVLNPKYTTTINGSVVMNSSSIRVNGGGKITFDGTVKGRIFALVNLVGNTQGNIYLQSIKGSVASTFIATVSYNYNLTELIFGTYFDNTSFLLQSAESNPVFDISEIWVEV